MAWISTAALVDKYNSDSSVLSSESLFESSLKSKLKSFLKYILLEKKKSLKDGNSKILAQRLKSRNYIEENKQTINK